MNILPFPNAPETSWNKNIGCKIMSERIAKFLARSGVCSRREAENFILEGRITVNGETIETPAFLVDGSETILFDGEKIAQKDKTRLWLYHKPVGLVTTHKDTDNRPTVFENLHGFCQPAPWLAAGYFSW